jgi:5'-nucleotidase
MRILVTNDDGIYSPGLLALAEAARDFGTVRIVAPDVEQSSMSHAITSSRPLRCRKTPIKDFEAYRVNGTPADCVSLGIHLWEKSEIVFSGVNLGSNLGNALWHSGTLAGAKQAVLLGLRGIAFSAPAGESQPDFEGLRPHLARVLGLLLADPALALVNVNFPEGAPQGISWTRQSVRHYDGRVVPSEDPMGRQHYWITVAPVEETERGTDRWAVDNGFTSITPLRLDLTDEVRLQRIQAEHSRAVSGVKEPA